VEFDEQGSPRLIIGTLLDITSRKEAEAERQLVNTVFTGITDGICITDAKRCILRINTAFTLITGYTEADVGAKPAPAKFRRAQCRILQ
jgi:PAS domain-containing protein